MRLRHLTLAMLLLLPLAAACAEEGKPLRLDVTASDFAFDGVPQTITGGRIDLTFANEGEVGHEFGLVDISGRTVDDFSKAAAGFMGGGPIPEWLAALSVPAEVEPGKTVETSFDLPQGDYLLFCALTEEPGGKEGAPHFERGMRQDVRAEGDNGEELTARGGRFTAKDYTFETPGQLPAGKSRFVFVNEGPDQWHFMSLSVFPAGVDAEQGEAAFAKLLTLEEGQEPPKDLPMPEDAAETGIFSVGLGQTFEATFEEGRTYVAACFVQDRSGGPPHAVGHKMYKAFTVSG